MRAAIMVVPMGLTVKGAVDVYSNTSPGLRTGTVTVHVIAGIDDVPGIDPDLSLVNGDA
jgi:hypothetical protein